MRRKDKRVYVVHWTEDIATGEELAGGQRYKDVTGLTYEGSLRVWLRRVDCYQREAVICSRRCRIIYAAPKGMRGKSISYVTSQGRKYGLRAEYEKRNKPSGAFRKFLREVGVLFLAFLCGLAFAFLVCAADYVSQPAHSFEILTVEEVL